MRAGISLCIWKSIKGLFANRRRLNLLDLGCGAGTIANPMTIVEDDVLVSDASSEMIAKAKATFSVIEFSVADAMAIHFNQAGDVVFPSFFIVMVKWGQ